jgi:hypothetical protein
VGEAWPPRTSEGDQRRTRRGPRSLCCVSDLVFSFCLGGGLVAAALRRWALHGGGFLGVVASASFVLFQRWVASIVSTPAFVWL